MKDTHFYSPQDRFERFVPLYTPDEKKGIRKFDEKKDEIKLILKYKNTGKYNYFSGGTGLVSSANDYARFCR
jgi:CubicO group peptidase (beta-lactamase class C family)